MISQENLPNHVVLMLDGNRRWLEKKGLKNLSAHEFGASNLRTFLDDFLRQESVKASFLTIWGSSIDNLTKRQKSEVDSIFEVYKKYFQELRIRKELKENQIKINFFGEWREFLPKDLQEVLEEIMETTKDHQGPVLSFLLAYSGKAEMLEAILKIKQQKGEADEKTLLKNLWTGELPPVDLVIRTGIHEGDAPHWSSGFMMWHCADAQMYFTETLWPDFTVEEFKKAIEIYQSSQRRFGK